MNLPTVAVRGRGPLLLACRLSGFMPPIAVLLSVSTGSASMAVAVPLLLASGAWQLWLFKPAVVVSDREVRLRGLLKHRTFRRDEVVGFEVQETRRSLDQKAREVDLVVLLSGGRSEAFRWVAWQDLVSPFIAAPRPLPTTSQRRVLSKLEGAI